METESWRWVWLAAAVIFAFAELAVPGTFFMLSFAIGAVVACIAAFADTGSAVQWVLFVAGTVAALAGLIPLGRRLNASKSSTPTGAERLIGQSAIVLQAIPAGPVETGLVRVEREEWRAQSENDAAVPEGAQVRVVRVDGTRLVVRTEA